MREEILTSAQQCFAKFGFKKTTLDDIGKMHNLNKASLYYYFKSKEELFEAVLEQELEDYLSNLEEIHQQKAGKP